MLKRQVDRRLVKQLVRDFAADDGADESRGLAPLQLRIEVIEDAVAAEQDAAAALGMACMKRLL